MRFMPCTSKFELLIKNFQSNYKYIELMVDDLIIFSKHPALMIQPLKEIQKYKLKGVSSPGY